MAVDKATSAELAINDVLELVTATVRWSRASQTSKIFLSGTLWYGMMCRSFLLLERILRSAIAELSQLGPVAATEIAKERAGGKPIAQMTFGQCVAFAEVLVPLVSVRLNNSEFGTDRSLLSHADVQLWKRAVFLRNRMAHHGPGFLDSVDLSAQRIWRSPVEEREPLEVQAEEIWRLCRQLCSSSLIISYLAIKGIPASLTRAQIAKAEQAVMELQLDTRQELRTIGHAASIAVNEFHAPSPENGPSQGSVKRST